MLDDTYHLTTVDLLTSWHENSNNHEAVDKQGHDARVANGQGILYHKMNALKHFYANNTPIQC